MISQISFLFDQYPMLQHIIAVAIGCRIVFKPLFKIIGKYVELTVEKDDDKRLHKIMDSKSYKLTAFIVDMMASVKLPKVKKKENNGK